MEGITVCQPPLPAALVDELLVFWQDIFQTDYRLFRSILNGDECEHNRDVFYLVRDGDRTVGSCHLTFPVADPALGGLGEVATAPAARGRGIASELCAMARDDFRRAGGSALFLGTANPAAARIYHRLGWRKLAGAHAMAHIADGRSPEAFFIDHFATGGSAIIAAGTAAARIPMIPLILCPHDDRLLDANAGWVSTRYADQSSCMGLYPRYAALDAWFCARAGDGRAVGLASARTHGADGCQVDAFTHRLWEDAWEDLLAPAVAWAMPRGSCWMDVLCEDGEKIARAEKLGFRHVGVARNVGDRTTGAVRLQKSP